MTLGFPLVAPDKIEISAMPRKGPAVMQRPDHRNILFPQIVEQHLIIEIIAMNIVQMNNIRLYFGPQPFDQPFRCMTAAQTMPVPQQAIPAAMNLLVQRRIDLNRLQDFRFSFADREPCSNSTPFVGPADRSLRLFSRSNRNSTSY